VIAGSSTPGLNEDIGDPSPGIFQNDTTSPPVLASTATIFQNSKFEKKLFF
jgi:hypothetical protein